MHLIYSRIGFLDECWTEEGSLWCTRPPRVMGFFTLTKPLQRTSLETKKHVYPQCERLPHTWHRSRAPSEEGGTANNSSRAEITGDSVPVSWKFRGTASADFALREPGGGFLER